MWYFLFCLLTLISAEIITLIKDNQVICVVTEKSAPLQPFTEPDGEVIDYRKIDRKKISEKIDNGWINDDWTQHDNLRESYFGPVLDGRWENFNSSNCNSSSIETKKMPSSFSVCITKDLNFTLRNFGETRSENCPLQRSQDQESLTGTCAWHHYGITINKINTTIEFITKNGIKKNCSAQFEITDVDLPECPIWKMHDYEFRSSSNITKKEESSLSVSSSDNLCFSLYVSVDEECFLNITLKTNSTSNTIKVDGFNKKNEPRSWQLIEIKVDSNGTGILSFFRGHERKNSTTGFWAIDDIKFCRSMEMYTATLPKNYSNEQLCVPLKKENSTNEIPYCPSGYLGKNCNINCSEVLEESDSTCQKYKICNGDNCTCAWGFQGPNCDQSCPESYWGLNCNSKCDSWCKTCDSQNGCLEALPFLLKAPVLKSLTNSSVTISVEDSTYSNDTITMTPQYFQIQYKKDGENVFENYSTHRNFSRIHEDIEILGLSINTSDYNVRILLNVDNSSYEKVPQLKIYRRSLRGTLYSSYKESYMKLTWNGIHENNSAVVSYKLQYECNNKFCSAENVSNTTETTNTISGISNLKNSKSCKVRLFSFGNLIDEIVLDHNDTDINDNEFPRNVIFLDKHFRMELPECENFKGALVYHLKWLNESDTKNLTKYDGYIDIFVGYVANYSRINLTVTANRLDKTKEKNFVVEIPKLEHTTVPFQKSMRFPITTTKPEASLDPQTKKGGLEIIIVVIVLTVVTICLICLLFFLYQYRKFPFRIENKDFEPCEIQPFVENSNNEDIEINRFEDYLLTSIGEDDENNELKKQYERIPLNFDNEKVYGSMPENKKKNRYKNIIPYDSTRVVLKDNDGDYINANYIDGYEARKTFIATQAPLPGTIKDFWSMVWQEKASAIVMLTKLEENGTVKCEKYWPDYQSDYQSEIKFGKFFIENTSTLEYPDYVHRKLQVKFDDKAHLVDHFQYVTWPDHGVPRNVQDFASFMKKIVDLPHNAPIVVHCNAGCGRTGTVILCDIALRMAAKEDRINFVKILTKMREQRSNQVSCVEQYIFAHFVVLECMLVPDFSIPVDDDFQEKLQKALTDSPMMSLMGNIHRVTEKHEKKNFWTKASIADDEKNFLSGLERLMSNNNAVIVDGYKFPNRFVVAQQPLPNTVSDFWKMVQNFDFGLIVSLNEIEESDPRCPKFWPKHSKQNLLVHDNKVLYFNSEISYKFHNEIKVDYNNEKDIVIIDVKNWKRETLTPENINDLICLWKEISGHKNKILVICYDGITASGLFVALSFLIEKIDEENVCDVFSAVRTVKNNRVEFVRDPVQIKFLYTAAQRYAKEILE